VGVLIIYLIGNDTNKSFVTQILLFDIEAKEPYFGFHNRDSSVIGSSVVLSPISTKFVIEYNRNEVKMNRTMKSVKNRTV
jgi:hypothetical protein